MIEYTHKNTYRSYNINKDKYQLENSIGHVSLKFLKENKKKKSFRKNRKYPSKYPTKMYIVSRRKKKCI